MTTILIRTELITTMTMIEAIMSDDANVIKISMYIMVLIIVVFAVRIMYSVRLFQYYPC